MESAEIDCIGVSRNQKRLNDFSGMNGQLSKVVLNPHCTREHDWSCLSKPPGSHGMEKVYTLSICLAFHVLIARFIPSP